MTKIPKEPSMRDKIAEMNKKVEAELKQWEVVGMNPAQIVVDPHFLQHQVNALIRVLLKNGIVDEDECTLAMKEYQLEQLQTIRMQEEDVVRAQRLESIAVPMMPSGLPKIPRKH